MEKKRGRPLMSSEERELKRIVRNKRENERKKALAWKDQKIIANGIGVSIMNPKFAFLAHLSPRLTLSLHPPAKP